MHDSDRPVLSVRVSPYVAMEVDRIAAANGITRSAVLAELIRSGLLSRDTVFAPREQIPA